MDNSENKTENKTDQSQQRIDDIRTRLKCLTKRLPTDHSSTSQANTRLDQTQPTSESVASYGSGMLPPRDFVKPNADIRKPFTSSSESASIPTKCSLPMPKRTDVRTPSISHFSSIETKPKTMPRSSSEKPSIRSTSSSSIFSDKSSSLSKTIKGRKYRVGTDEIGSGGSSKVYAGRSLDGNVEVAIKYVKLKDMDKAVLKAYMDEIKLLQDLQGSKYVIRMIDFDLTPSHLMIIMEKGETDLARFIKNNYSDIDGTWIKHYWYQMLKCVKVIHDKNIVHSDLKPANFLFVQARLKLIDFGIASKIQDDKTSVVKTDHMGTLNYMSPELLGSLKEGPGMGFKVPLKADVWSLGCILYLIVYGKTPFQHVSQMMKMPTILNEKHQIDFPKNERTNDLLIDVLKKCLERDVKKRPTVDELLEHPYLIESQQPTSDAEWNGNEEDLLKMVSELNKCTPRTGAKKLKKLMSSSSLRSLNMDDKENS